MIPNWPSLWERASELQPTHCDPNSQPECSLRLKRWTSPDGRSGWWWSNERLEPGNPWPMDQAGANRCVSEWQAAALCRDAAVRWLAKQDPQIYLNYFEGGSDGAPESKWSTCFLDYNYSDTGMATFPSETKGGRWWPTPDDALFAACKAVLDARDAARTPA